MIVLSKKLILILVAAGAVTTVGYSSQIKEPRQAEQVKQTDEQRGTYDIEKFLDLEYVPSGHERHKLDLYIPKGPEISGPLPLVVWVHGGAWKTGDKKACNFGKFTSRGYITACINYRLSQHAVFPAQIEDCKAAIRFLRANAKKYNIDTERIGAFGESAGGHLVALLGTACDVNEFDKGANLEFSSTVQAVCDYYGPTDLTRLSSFPSRLNHDAPDSPGSLLIGGPIQENKERCRAANPITYVTKDDPPFLIVHGDKDMTVPLNQSQLLYDALKQARVEVEFHTVKDGPHGFEIENAEVRGMTGAFFDKHLKPCD